MQLHNTIAIDVGLFYFQPKYLEVIITHVYIFKVIIIHVLYIYIYIYTYMYYRHYIKK